MTWGWNVDEQGKRGFAKGEMFQQEPSRRESRIFDICGFRVAEETAEVVGERGYYLLQYWKIRLITSKRNLCDTLSEGQRNSKC